MTPKEKAEDLVLSFLYIKQLIHDGWSGMNKQMAKQCALILVNEILKELESIDDQTAIPYDYWKQVKQEIQNL